MEGGPAVEIGLPIALAVIMLSMGMSLTRHDFRRVLETPKHVAVGVFAQVVVLPIIAFTVATVFPLEPVYAVSIVLLGAVPGGTMSNIIVHVGNADRALSVTLTAISNLIVLVTLPILLSIAFETFQDADQVIAVPAAEIVGALFLITVLPLSIGMRIRHVRPQLAVRFEEPAKRFAAVLMIVLVLGIAISEFDLIISDGPTFLPATIVLNAAAMGAGFGLAKLVGMGLKQAGTVAIEAGIQNGTLAITVALTILDNEEMAIIPGLYGAWMLAVGFTFAMWLDRRTRVSDAQPDSEHAAAR